MKNTSNIMFKIGKIINIILIPLYAIGILVGLVYAVIGIVGIVASEASDSYSYSSGSGVAEGGAMLAGIGIGLAIGLSVLLIFEIISLVVCSKKHKEIEAGNNETAPRIFLIVFGVLGENVFYILAGIFSLVARAQEGNAAPAAKETVVEAKAEEPEIQEVVVEPETKDEE